jgi:hypothetical protein
MSKKNYIYSPIWSRTEQEKMFLQHPYNIYSTNSALYFSSVMSKSVLSNLAALQMVIVKENIYKRNK